MKSNTEYKGFKTECSYDPFGNLLVWLPFGIAGNVLEDTEGSYTLSRSSLESTMNNISLAGIPVTWWHDDQMLTPDFKPEAPLGTCTGLWREKTPGIFEVQAMISDLKMIAAIEAKQSFETSPGYITWNAGEDRYYNHIAIIPPGYAKGGRAMTVKTESMQIGSDKQLGSDTQLGSENTQLGSDTLVHKKLNNNSMTTETPINTSEIAEAVIAAMKTESESMKDLISAARIEGYQSGLLQGSKEAALRIRAESIELKVEDNCEFDVMVNALIAQYLPMLSTTGMTEAQTYALAEAAVCIAESKKKPEEISTEVKIETPKSLTIESNPVKIESTSVAKKPSNFLL